MTPEEQLEKWVAGESIHNEETGECVPDFSCCQDFYKAPQDERELFKNRPELRMQMLGNYLHKVLAASAWGREIEIVGTETGRYVPTKNH